MREPDGCDGGDGSGIGGGGGVVVVAFVRCRAEQSKAE